MNTVQIYINGTLFVFFLIFFLARFYQGADYVGAGACFSTNTKSDSTLIGLDAVKRIHSSVDIPVVAIGGINHSNAGQVLSETQVEGIAVVSAVFDKENITDACREMRKIVDRAK